MPNTALITGASAGIGAEFARYHASKGGDLILVARRQEALEALKAEIAGAHSVTVHVIAQDLGVTGGAEAVVAQVKGMGVDVDILINNAGFGGRGIHIDRPLSDEQEMIDLNVKALVTLTHAFGTQMAARGKGRILQVGSSAGFMPGPLQAVYFATKAFVNSYSQAVDQELRPRGVTCTVLAPGYVETEFAARADLDGTDLTKSGDTAQNVAQLGYEAMMAGKLVAINEFQIKVLAKILPLMPRRMALKMVEKMQTK